MKTLKKNYTAIVSISEYKCRHKAYVNIFHLSLLQSSLLSHVPLKSHLQSSLTPYRNYTVVWVRSQSYKNSQNLYNNLAWFRHSFNPKMDLTIHIRR